MGATADSRKNLYIRLRGELKGKKEFENSVYEGASVELPFNTHSHRTWRGESGDKGQRHHLPGVLFNPYVPDGERQGKKKRIEKGIRIESWSSSFVEKR